jgi:cobalt-zinc-cadmium efflux system protein
MTDQGDAFSPRRDPRGLLAALGITGVFLVVEVVGGLWTGSLALLADAGHMAGDAGALLLALLAFWIARRPFSARRSYGYLRAEVLAALANVAALWLIAGTVLLEAFGRLREPPFVDAGPMLGVALVGLMANGASAAVLSRSAGDSLNVRGALLHVVSDALGSVGAIAAGVAMLAFGWRWADPVASAFIALLIVAGSLRIAWQAVHILLQGAPSGMRLEELRRSLDELPGVQEVHDLHAWVLTSGYNVMSAHVCVAPGLSHEDEEEVLARVRQVAQGRYRITHVTVQLEHERMRCPEAHLPKER